MEYLIEQLLNQELLAIAPAVKREVFLPPPAHPSTAKQLRMRATADEVDPVCFGLVDQQKVSADVAFPVVSPVAF